jgi:hypothetical protein
VHQHLRKKISPSRIKTNFKIGNVLRPAVVRDREEGTRVCSTHMKASHLHIAFTDPLAAANWFKTVLKLVPLYENPKSSAFRIGDIDLVLDAEWGLGDTSMTFAFKSADCQRDYETAIGNGAKSRTPPRDKGDSINADVFGPANS